jgi:hypothetical protein
MPGFPFPGRPGGEHDEPLLDMIIARRALPPDAPQAMHDLVRMLAAMAGPAEPGELAGEAAVRAAFSRAASSAGVSSAARRPVRHRRTRRSRRPARSRAKLAAVLVVAAAGLGGVLAAYTDLLPSPTQQPVAASASHSSDQHRSLTLGMGKRVPRTVPTAARPTPRPDRSTGTHQATHRASDPARHSTPRYRRPTPRPSGLPVEPVCGTSAGHWTGPLQPKLCTSTPTTPAAQPTPNPSIP